jgi:RHS repeat-associated protein
MIYKYNPWRWLLEVKKNGSMMEAYTYDANGNRITEINILRRVNRSYTVSAEDHVITTGTKTYQFDADGFLINRTTPAGTMATTYSSRGELLSAPLPSGTNIAYDHDPIGRRITKHINGIITEKYLWKDAITLLAVYDASDNLIMRFNYADGRMPVSMTYQGNTYYLAYDQIGSPIAVTDSTGNIVKKIEYDSFGNIISDSNPSMMIPFGFAGGFQDRDTALVRFGVRDYDPTLGRWTAKDPIDFAGENTNLYGYVANDPVNIIDPTGQIGLDTLWNYIVKWVIKRILKIPLKDPMDIVVPPLNPSGQEQIEGDDDNDGVLNFQDPDSP